MILNEKNTTMHISRMKGGVSLFTVLMFMLVATIAATATYKWLTTESGSSKDRMLQREAYQSAVAGIESARGWMTYNANETGALIKQYKDGGNVPIKLNERLAAFVRAGQSYDVYLVGVSASPDNPTYKLKLASVGYARDKQVKHSEVAILNVNGLYQVRLPVEEAADTIKFEFNYFGGSTQAQGHIGAKSMLVNGDLFGSNPVYTETDLIVTGNVEISGNSVGADGTACVGGSLEAKNGVFGNDFYIEGDARNFGWPSASEAKNGYSGTSGDYNLAGNVYINGNLVQATKNQVFPKNLSLNGTWTTNLSGYNMSVTGNLCLGETGFIFLPTLDKTFKVEGNVWMPGNVGMPNNISFWKGTMSGNNCTCNKYKRTCKVSWGWGCWQYNDYELEDTDVPCTGNSTSGDHNTKYVVQYCSGDLDLNADDDNWAAYERLRLGMSPSSEVYIKNSHSLTDYKAMRDEKKGVTKPNFIQSCSGTNCVTPSYWSDETLYPYLKKDAHPADKPKEYYIYSLPAGINDVEYGPYHDEFWTKDIHAFFVNFPTGPGGKSANTTYTSSYHTQDDGAHPDLEGSNYYRFLNYSGGKIKGSPYCKKMGGKNFTPECGVAPWFSSDGTVSRIFPAEKPFECAESVKDYCLEKLGPHRPGCDGASYKVDDLLKTAYDKFEKYANKGCADVTTWNNDLSSKLNTCYTNNTKTDAIAKENLYNGYQVVKVTHTGKADPTDALNGKFIIIVTNKLGQQSLPPTTEGSYVFLYLPEGGENTVQPAVESGKYNYFIFTDQDVASGSGDAGFMFNNSVLSGSIYAKAENCAKVQNFKARKMEYNEKLVNDLQKNGVLCDAKATSCGGANTPTSSSSSDPTIEHGNGGYDSYYIGVAPQLSVTVESQYKNKEATNVEHAQDVNPSFIVLPRIVYLTKDAKGKLSNYYNIVPLNTTKSVTNPSVTCSGIPTTGKLTNVEAGDLLEEGTYTCNAEGSLVSAQSGGTSSARMRVPFWVVVRGEGGNGIPVASFAEPIKEVNIGASTVASLVLTNTTSGAAQSCLVKFSVSEHGEEWEVKHVEGNATPVPETPGVYTATVTSEGSLSVLNVTNKSSEDGSIILNVIDAGECNPGSPEVIYNANTARIERRDLKAYCNGDGSGDGQCSPGGEYDKAKNRPDCATAEEWVSAKGNSCSVEATNNTWNCAISGNVSLDAASSIEGCETIIVPQSIPAPLTVNETYYLYASLKAKPMTFHAGFETGGEISGNPVIKIEVKDENGTERKSNCSYSNFKDPENTSCDVLVYRNSTVTLTLDPENPKDFNYWKCESGPDCFSDEPFTGNSYLITVTGDGNIVYAHFGEQDKHCFFDEFKDARESGGTVKLNRGTVQCEENSTNYCIDYCENDGNKCATNQVTSSFPNAKWRLVERSTASWEDIDYSSADARIALKSSATRGKKESEKKQAIIMSSVQAGLYGTLKALFQPPHEGVSAGDEAKATVKKSGFILRSNSEVDSYLMLNVFIASDGVLKARLCVNGGSSCSEDVVLKRNGSSYSPERNHLVTLSATIEKKVGESYDVLTVEIYSSAWAEEPYSAEIKLSDGEISGVTNTGDLPNEYVGYALSDQNFKIYGIGWRSETYNASCWDTYPTISCSFKAAYPAGIVPVNSAAKPWVGFSAWFDAVDAKCDEEHVNYHYMGDDACGGSGSIWTNCTGDKPYTFSKTGAHGYYGDDEKAVRMARISVLPENCVVYGSEANWLGTSTATDCGPFWVGELNACSRHYIFKPTTSAGDGNYFGLEGGTANVRGATLYVTLDNPNGKKVEVYLFSKNETDRYTYGNDYIYSLPYLSSQMGEGVKLEILVENLSNAEGFDPEHVLGVYVKTFDDPTVEIKTVESSCPNAVEITGCNANYSGGKWNIVAEIKNKSHTDKIEVVETHSYISDPSSLACYYDSNSPACEFDGDNAKFGWTDNPYAGHAGAEYEFRISLTSKENTTSECTTTGSVTGITPTCGSVSQNTILQGKGLPQFTYGISNCPDTQCGYKITLVGPENVDITSASSGNVNTTTATDVANTSTALTAGAYKFKLESTNNDRPFETCFSDEFAVEEPGVITASPCSFNSIVKGASTATLTMSNIANVVENTNITIHSGSHTITKTLSSGATSATFSDVPAPSDANTYTYTIDYTVNGNTKTICSATLNVLEGLGCSVSTSSITLGENFTFTPTYGGSCTSASLTGNGTISGSGCGASSFTVTPSSPGSQTYTYTFSGSIGNNVTCQQTVTVNPPAPEFTCPDNWRGAVGSNVTFNPGSSLKYCSSDYPCVLKIDGVTKSSSWTGPTYEWKDDAATTSTNKYTISLKNSYNDAATVHDCSIKYSSGNANCAWENGATSFWPGQQNVKLIVSDIQNLASDAEFTLTCGTSSTKSTCRTGGSCDNLQFSVPSTVGTYACTLKNNTMTLCSPSLQVKAPLSCSVTSNTVDYGGKFKFTGKTATSSCHNCKLYRGNNEYQYTDNQSNIEDYEITFNWSEPKTFTYECQCDNMDASANKCSQTVASQVNPPTFDCKTGLKATIDKSNNVTIGLENVVGCHEGGSWCEYRITGTGISEKTGTGISNGSVNLGAFTDNGTDGSTKTYSVTLENSAGVGETQTCSVEFTAGSSNRVIDSDVMTFTVTNGETFCFENHNRPATYNTTAQVNCGQCQGNDCSGTFDGSSVGAHKYFSKYMTVVNNVFSGCITINWSGDQNGDTQRTCNIYAY